MGKIEKTVKLNGFKIEPLADKLSDIIVQAVNDLRSCERSSRYRINMGTWHEADTMYDDEIAGHIAAPHGQCEVCLAGAWLSRRSDVPPTVDIDPSDRFSVAALNVEYNDREGNIDRLENRNATKVSRAMIALDAARKSGHEAVRTFYGSIPKRLNDALHEFTDDERFHSTRLWEQGYPVSYEESPRAFKLRLMKLAEILRDHGY